MDRFGDKYDLHRIAKLPEDEINVGTLTVTPIITEDMEIDENKNIGSRDYLILVENFDIPLTYIDKKAKNKDEPPESHFKQYSFMLILPKEVIQDKIDLVNSDVGGDILKYFIGPFIIFSIIMMIVISNCLVKISTEITNPIIELGEKISDIIREDEKEKWILIES